MRRVILLLAVLGMGPGDCGAYLGAVEFVW